tara:strand:- start:3570 stop:3995 length:426 start_codon:yes stop_codon:yes gene_type:complete
MNLTLYVDSSLCQDTKALGWGAVLEFQTATINLSGRKICKENKYEVEGAECALAAVYDFIFELDEKIELGSLKLVVDSDEIERNLDYLPLNHFKNVEVVVLKSHSKVISHKIGMNSLCDSLAKQSMRELRKFVYEYRKNNS